jgi:hypothetical protein
MHNVCRYAPNIDPTSNSAYPIKIMRIFRLAEEAPPAIVATLHEAQKTIPDQSLSIKEAEGQYCPRFYGVSLLPRNALNEHNAAAGMTGPRTGNRHQRAMSCRR